MKHYASNELKNAVYMYIAEHKYASLHEISNALKIENGKELWNVVKELQSEFYITLNPISLDEKDSGNSSCRFNATKKAYVPKDI